MEAPYMVAGALPPPPSADDAGAARAPLLPPPPPFLPPCPGAVSIHKLEGRDLSSLLDSGGRAILIVSESPAADADAPALPARPRGRRGGSGGSGGGGSYCCSVRVAGVFSGAARVVAERRVAVQAVDAGAGLAAAADLPDRWVYMVRASAVEEAVEAMLSAVAAGEQQQQQWGRDVSTAAAQALDAASEVARELSACRGLAATLATPGGAGSAAGGAAAALEAAAAEAEEESGRVLEFVFGQDWEGAGSGGGGGGEGSTRTPAVSSWDEVVRLSWAPFAASALLSLADAAGGAGGGGVSGGGGLAARRLRAMEAMDVGLRLEDGLELAGEARRRLAAAAALRRA